MRWFRVLSVACVLAVWIALPVQVGTAQDGAPGSQDLLARFDAIVQAEMAYYHIPGAAVAVIQDGEVVFTQGYGVRSVTTGEPFTPQTQFRVGSTTKSMTALMIAQLVDEGVLDWDTPITNVLPDFQTSEPELTARLVVRDLMGMGTGLEADPLTSLEWGEWAEADLFDAVAAMPVAGEYRAHYAYNNEVFALAGYVAAKAAGRPSTLETYRQLMQTRVFDLLGMESTLITDDIGDLSANYAESYSLNLFDGYAVPDPVLPAPIHVVAPAGGTWSTLDDMARYVITRMNGGVSPEGVRIVSEFNLVATWEPQVTMPADNPEIERMAYAMGWVVGTYHGVSFRYHDGGWDGYRTMMGVFPQTQSGLVIFCNHLYGDLFNHALLFAFGELVNGGDPEPLLADFRNQFDEQFGSLDAQLAFLPPPEVTPEEVAPLLGRYEGGWAVALGEDNRLRIERPNWVFRLRPLPGKHLYLIASGAAIGTMVQFDLDGEQVTLTLELDSDGITLARIE